MDGDSDSSACGYAEPRTVNPRRGISEETRRGWGPAASGKKLAAWRKSAGGNRTMLGVLIVSAVTALGMADGPALIDAAKNADQAAVRALVQKKVDVNTAEPDGTTALHWASYRDDLETVDLLIRAGAKVNAATDLGVTPLWNASQNGSDAMVRRLLQAGANPNAGLAAGETAMMVASRSG